MNTANQYLNQYLNEWVVLTRHNGEQTRIKVMGYTTDYVRGYDVERVNWSVELKTVKKINVQ